MLKRIPSQPHQFWQTAALVLTTGLMSTTAFPLQATTLAQAGASKPIVVATTSVLCDVTKQIAQDTVDLKCLIAPGEDPHEYRPKPEDSKAIEQAKLILYGGYNFEPGLIRLITASSNPAPKVAVDSDAVPVPQMFEDDGRTVVDPHVFHNAANGAAIAKVVAKNLAKLEPDQAARYEANGQKLSAELTQIDTWIKAEIATIPEAQRKLVTTHDAFGYYAKAYGIELAGALQGVSTEEQVTPRRVTELVKGIQESHVPTIFAEDTINPRLIKAVAREAHVKVAERQLYGDGIGGPGTEADTYPNMLIANTKTIVTSLGGQYTAFQPQPSAAQPKMLQLK